jgi:sulfate transport system ATP-binding protein
MLIGADQNGVRVESPEHATAKDAKAFAYVRPHDLDVRRYQAGEEDNLSGYQPQRGIPAKLVRAIVVGPIARLELLPLDTSTSGSTDILEAHIGAQQYREMALREGETLVLTPRKAKVFVA